MKNLNKIGYGCEVRFVNQNARKVDIPSWHKEVGSISDAKAKERADYYEKISQKYKQEAQEDLAKLETELSQNNLDILAVARSKVTKEGISKNMFDAWGENRAYMPKTVWALEKIRAKWPNIDNLHTGDEVQIENAVFSVFRNEKEIKRISLIGGVDNGGGSGQGGHLNGGNETGGEDFGNEGNENRQGGNLDNGNNGNGGNEQGGDLENSENADQNGGNLNGGVGSEDQGASGAEGNGPETYLSNFYTYDAEKGNTGYYAQEKQSRKAKEGKISSRGSNGMKSHGPNAGSDEDLGVYEETDKNGRTDWPEGIERGPQQGWRELAKKSEAEALKMEEKIYGKDGDLDEEKLRAGALVPKLHLLKSQKEIAESQHKKMLEKGNKDAEKVAKEIVDKYDIQIRKADEEIKKQEEIADAMLAINELQHINFSDFVSPRRSTDPEKLEDSPINTGKISEVEKKMKEEVELYKNRKDRDSKKTNIEACVRNVESRGNRDKVLNIKMYDETVAELKKWKDIQEFRDKVSKIKKDNPETLRAADEALETITGSTTYKAQDWEIGLKSLQEYRKKSKETTNQKEIDDIKKTLGKLPDAKSLTVDDVIKIENEFKIRKIQNVVLSQGKDLPKLDEGSIKKLNELVALLDRAEAVMKVRDLMDEVQRKFTKVPNVREKFVIKTAEDAAKYAQWTEPFRTAEREFLELWKKYYTGYAQDKAKEWEKIAEDKDLVKDITSDRMEKFKRAKLDVESLEEQYQLYLISKKQRQLSPDEEKQYKKDRKKAEKDK